MIRSHGNWKKAKKEMDCVEDGRVVDQDVVETTDVEGIDRCC